MEWKTTGRNVRPPASNENYMFLLLYCHHVDPSELHLIGVSIQNSAVNLGLTLRTSGECFRDQSLGLL